jgi:hypothetical protein
MKRSQNITHYSVENKIKRWERMTFGSNHHIPYIKTQDIKSNGSKNRSPDFENAGRDRDYLSVNEGLYYLMLMFNPRITWIKEQYPLLPWERAQYIAKELSLRYPTYPFTSAVPIVMTSDFYCGTIFGGEVVYSIKDRREFLDPKKKKNVENKQKIEKAFWESQGINWYLILDNQIKTPFTQNLEQIAPGIILNSPISFIFPRWLNALKQFLPQFREQKLADVIARLAEISEIEYEESISCFHHAVWHRHLYINLNCRIEYIMTLEELGVAIRAD